MTISTQTISDSFNGDGSTTAFATTFKFYDSSDLLVIERTTSTNAEVTKTLTTDYTVSGGSGATGTVTMNSAPASGVELHIIRNAPYTQATDLITGEQLPAETIEAAIDKQNMQIQQLKEKLDRTIQFEKTAGESGWEIDQDAVTANYYLQINSSGDGITTSAGSGGGGAGETNTMSNVGAGAGVYKQKAGVDFEMYTLNAASAKISVTANTGSNTIDFDLGTVALSDLSDGANALTAAGTATLTNKTIDADGTGNTITNIGSSEIKAELVTGLTEDATPTSGDYILGTSGGVLKKFDVGNLPTGGGGEANTYTNGGTGGVGIVLTKSGVNLPFKSIGADAGITVTDDTGNNRVDLGVDISGLTDIASTPVSGDYFMVYDTSATTVKKVNVDDMPGGGGGIANVVEDTTPQLGGMLDVNGQAIGDGTLELLAFTETASAVNHIGIKNNTTTNDPEVQAVGDDTNINLNLVAKGSGVVQAGGAEVTTAANTATFTNKTFNCDSTGNTLTNVGSSEIKAEIVSGLTEETAPASGDFLLGMESGGALRKFDIGNLPSSGGSAAWTVATKSGDYTIQTTDTRTIFYTTNTTTVTTFTLPLLSGISDGFEIIVISRKTGGAQYTNKIVENGGDTGALIDQIAGSAPDGYGAWTHVMRVNGAWRVVGRSQPLVNLRQATGNGQIYKGANGQTVSVTITGNTTIQLPVKADVTEGWYTDIHIVSASGNTLTITEDLATDLGATIWSSSKDNTFVRIMYLTTAWEVVMSSDVILETDTTPKLGADLNMNGFILDDANGNELLSFQENASAVNFLKIANSATGNDLIVSANGDDTNVDIDIQTKGSGKLYYNGTEVATGGATGAWSTNTDNANVTLTASDDRTVCFNGSASADRTITLPEISSVSTGWETKVCCDAAIFSTYTLKVNHHANDSSGSTVATIRQQNGYVHIQLNGSAWQIIDQDDRDVANEYVQQQGFDMQSLTDGANIAWNLDNAQCAKVTLAGNRTLDNPTNIQEGTTYVLTVVQDATGSRTLAYGTNYFFPGSTDPTLTTAANAIDVLTFVGHNGKMLGVSNLNFGT